MSGHRSTPEIIARAKEMRARGFTFKRIGDLLGFTDGAIHNWLNGRRKTDYEEKPKPRPKPKTASPKPELNPATAAEIRRLHRKGMGRTEIAALTGARYAEIEEALK